MPKTIGQKTYYSVPEAAEYAGVSRATMARWVKHGLPPLGGKIIPLRAVKDPFSGHYYLPAEIVELLGNRLEAVAPEPLDHGATASVDRSDEDRSTQDSIEDHVAKPS